MTRFKKGQSGCPSGKPRGTLSYTTKLREALKQDLPKLLEKLKNMAMDGDSSAMKLLLERALPPIKSEKEAIHIPELEAAETPIEKANVIYGAIAQGQISIDTGAQLLTSLLDLIKVSEAQELEERLVELESKIEKNRSITTLK